MLKLLIVDDENITREGLTHFINWNELNLELIGEAEDGRIALNIFEKNQADIVITDIRMPNMDGLELIKNIKSIDISTVIILLSAYDDFKYAQQAIKLGAFEYILKPIDPDILKNVAKNAVEFRLSQLEKASKVIPEINSDEMDFFAEENHHYSLKFQEELLRTLKSGDSQKMQDVLHNLWNTLLGKNYTLELFKRFSFEMSHFLIQCMVEIHEKPHRLFASQDPWVIISQMKSKDALYQWLNNTIIDVCEIVQRKKKYKHHNKIVNEVLKLIAEKYTDTNLTLSILADLLYVTPNYLSAVFKDETGIGFMDYLTDYRIEKSKELLTDLKYKIYEIAYAVGYSDSHYFSKIFKKYTGMTPKEFRERTI